VFAILAYCGIGVYIPLSLAPLLGYVVYPAYAEFVGFSTDTKPLDEELLCSSCRHYNDSGQFCQLYDEHVRPDYIPCGGDDWEPS